MAKNKKPKKQPKLDIMKEKFYGAEVNGAIYYTKDFDLDFLRGLALMKEVVERSK